VPKHVQEAQILLRRVQEQQQLRASSSASPAAGSVSPVPVSASASSLSATSIIPVLGRHDLLHSMLHALSLQPDLPPGVHTGLQSPEALLCADVRVDSKRKLSSRLVIYGVSVVEPNSDGGDQHEGEAAGDGLTSDAAASPNGSASAPAGAGAGPAPLNMDKLQLLAPLEYFAPLEPVAEEDGAATSDASSSAAASKAAFSSLHSLVRRGDVVRVWGWPGLNRAASERVLFVRFVELRQVGAQRIELLQQRASYHGLQQ